MGAARRRGGGALWTHFTPAAHDHGMPATTASAQLALIGVFNIARTIASGRLTGRYDPRRLLAWYFAQQPQRLDPVPQGNLRVRRDVRVLARTALSAISMDTAARTAKGPTSHNLDVQRTRTLIQPFPPFMCIAEKEEGPTWRQWYDKNTRPNRR